MAADWIPMRLDLDEDPAVLEMAERLNMGIWDVVGRCWRVWVWASRNCHAESVTGVTLCHINMATHVTLEFLDAMVAAGWLRVIEADVSGGKPGIQWPHWDRWLSETAKSRGLAAIRKRRQRAKNVTEKSRSERDTCPDLVTPTEQNTVHSNNKKRELSFSSSDSDVANKIWQAVREAFPNSKPPAMGPWANTVRLMVERDGKTHGQILELFTWANRHSFWSANIRSPHRLREKWEQLEAQRTSKPEPKRQPAKQPQTAADIMRLLED